MSWVSCLLLCILVCTIHFWMKLKLKYWEHFNVPFLPPELIVGNLKNLFLLRTSFGEFFSHLYATPTFQNEPVLGLYILHTPALLIRDPHLVMQILIKNFNSFPNRYEAADRMHDAMGALSLPLAKYAEWREGRRKMTKLFTTGHLRKKMFIRVKNIAADLEGYVGKNLQENNHNSIIEVKEMCALYTTDVSAALLFRTETGGLRSNGSHLREQCIKLFQPSFHKIFNFLTIFFLPRYVGLLRSKVFPRQYANFMRNLVKNILHQRKEVFCDSSDTDLIDLLLQFQRSRTGAKFDWLRHPDYIASQAAVFLLAGFETSSALMAFILYELAKQPRIQEELRAELKAYSNLGEEVSDEYDKIIMMPQLNMIIAEGLRLYPTAPFINREYLPNGDEHINLEPLKNFSMPKGMPTYISILGIHRDPKYWPSPNSFRPERFSHDNAKRIKPMTYIPFGAGPHGCIGSRLGLLQVKLGLAHILKSYHVETCELTVPEIVFDPKSFMLQAKGEIYLNFRRHK